jgi:carbamoyl-phosphate synthase large subunit
VRILSLGAGGSAADNFTKCVRHRHYVVGADTNEYLLHLSCAHDTVMLDTRPADDDHLGEILEVCRRFDLDFVHAQPDEEALFVAENARALQRCGIRTLMPAAGVVDTCQDKLKTAQLLGPELAPESHAYPRRPSPSAPYWLRATTGAGSLGALPVENMTQAKPWVDMWQRRNPGLKFMVAELLPGPDRSWTSVWRAGELISHVARERVQYMGARLSPSGQTSTPQVARLIHDEALTDLCVRSIQKIDYRPNGIYYVDTKGHPDGTQRVTEINAGRFNTTINAWAAAGLNLPLTYLYAAEGLITAPDPTIDQYRTGLWIRQPDMEPRFVPD